MKKFYCVVHKLDHDALNPYDDHRVLSRSKVYGSYMEAETKAVQYLQEGRAEKYYIMEAVSCVETKPKEYIVTKPE
jgi:hypothetical protein